MGFPFEPVIIGSLKALQRLLQNNPDIPCRLRRKLYFEIITKHTFKETRRVQLIFSKTINNYYKRSLLLFETWFIFFACVIHKVDHLLTIYFLTYCQKRYSKCGAELHSFLLSLSIRQQTPNIFDRRLALIQTT